MADEYVYKVILDGHPSDAKNVIFQLTGEKVIDYGGIYSTKTNVVVDGNNIVLDIVYKIPNSRSSLNIYPQASAAVYLLLDNDDNKQLLDNWFYELEEKADKNIIRGIITNPMPLKPKYLPDYLADNCSDCLMLDQNNIKQSFQILAKNIYYTKVKPTNIVKIALINIPENVIRQIYKDFGYEYIATNKFITRDYTINQRKIRAEIWFLKYENNKKENDFGADVYGVWQDNKISRILDSGFPDVPVFILAEDYKINPNRFQDYYVEPNFKPTKTIEYMVLKGFKSSQKKSRMIGFSSIAI